MICGNPPRWAFAWADAEEERAPRFLRSLCGSDGGFVSAQDRAGTRDGASTAVYKVWTSSRELSAPPTLSRTAGPRLSLRRPGTRARNDFPVRERRPRALTHHELLHHSGRLRKFSRSMTTAPFTGPCILPGPGDAGPAHLAGKAQESFRLLLPQATGTKLADLASKWWRPAPSLAASPSPSHLRIGMWIVGAMSLPTGTPAASKSSAKRGVPRLCADALSSGSPWC